MDKNDEIEVLNLVEITKSKSIGKVKYAPSFVC